jgi:adenylate cyclase
MSRRLGLWVTVLALPLAALVLLAAEPDLDRRWEHHPSHFWLVLTVAGVNVALGLIASEAASRRDDDRTFLVSMALLASAGFLGLHALATPGILLDDITAGFSVAARVGLLLAAGFAAVSALGSDTRVVRVLARNHRRVRVVLWVILAAWAIASLARVPLLDRPLPPDALPPPLGLLTLVGVVLYGIAAVRYAELYRRRRRPLPLAVLVAFILMAEAMIAVAFSRTWHAMWWEWHVLMAVAFGAILVAARVEYRREGSLGAVFAGIYLDSTLRRIDRNDAGRLSEVVDAIRSGGPVDEILARFRREGMSREEADVLERSARELSRVDELFRLYVAPQLAASLERQPERARLGGEEREVSVLFADLAGFTALLGGAARQRRDPDAEPVLGHGRARGRPRGRAHRPVRGGRHHRRLQRRHRAARSRPARREGGAGDLLGRRPPRRRPLQLATVPGRGEHGPRGRRERRRRPPAQLHGDRRHHQPGGATAVHGAPGRGRHRAHDA